MSRIVKPWESRLSTLLPYLAWGGLAPDHRCCWTTSRHSNTCYELHIILEGNCSLAFDAGVHPMSAGQAVMIAPNVFHAPSHVSEAFCRFSLSFSVDGELISVMDGVNEDGYRFFQPDNRVLSLCREILRELDGDSFLKRELTSALFSELMILCLRTVYNPKSKNLTEEKNLTQDEIEEFHLSTLKLAFDEAVSEYEKRSSTPLGRLLKNRELPILNHAKTVLDTL